LLSVRFFTFPTAPVESRNIRNKRFSVRFRFKYWILIYLSRYLDQETAKGPFRSTSQAATCYYQSNHSNVEAISLSALPKDTTSHLGYDFYYKDTSFLPKTDC